MSPLSGSSMHKAQTESINQNNEGSMIGGNGVVNATAKYRAAGIVAAAARAERDYHLATLHLQTKLAEAAERRALTNLSASMQGPMKDDYEVAQACLNLRTDGKDGMYPMVDPNYGRMNDPSRHNGSEVPPGMPGGPMMHNPSYVGHHRYLNPNAPSLSMMDPHMHPLQNAQLEPLPREMHPHGPMAGGMHYIPDYHGGGLGGKRKYDPSSIEGAYTKKMKSAFQGSSSSSVTTKSQDTKKGKRPADMPRRPLSAYNFFFSEERERVLASLPSPDGKDEPKKTTDCGDKTNETTSEDAADKPSTPKGSSASPEGSDSNTEDTPKVTPEGTPKATPEGTPKASPEGPKATPEGTPEASDGTPGGSGVTPDGSKASEAANGSPGNASPKTRQSNQDRLLSLRLVQNNIRRPHRKTHGKIGFKALAKLIGERWRGLTAEKKVPYRKLAETDLARYKEQMEEYNRKNKWAFLQDSESQPPAVK